jgi:hypothetical protein
VSKAPAVNRQHANVAQPAVQPQSWWRGPGPLIAATTLVAFVVVVFLVVSNRQSSGQDATLPVPAAVLTSVTQVDPQVSAAVGSGGLPNPLQAVATTPVLQGATGKPQVTYIGAGFCPYCAAQRWSMIVALSRFGSFTGLQLARSSSTDIYPNTNTFTFYGSSYTSDYLDFSSVEETGQDQQSHLQTPTAAQQQLLDQYDGPPYATSRGGIPFLDIGNQYIAISSGYSPALLTGMTWQEIATALSDAKAPTTMAIVGNANYLTAALCQVTGDQPASTCNAAPIPQLKQQLAKH